MDVRVRKDIPEEEKWDLESMYKNNEDWYIDFNKAKGLADKFKVHRGNITNSQDLNSALKEKDQLYRLVENIYSYAHMNLDVDTRDNSAQEISDKAIGLLTEVEEKLSFLVPEILILDEEKIKEFIDENKDLKMYEHYLYDLIREKKHVLSSREESILAQFGEVGNTPQKIYSMLNTADMKFPKIKNSDGEEIELTQGNFIPFMESRDREVRINAFNALYQTYDRFKNTYAAILNGDLKNNIVNSRLRTYNSSLEASLSTYNIPTAVYDNLLGAIHDNLDVMHKYMKIRKKALGLDELHMYDLYVPIVQNVDFNIPYNEGISLVKESLKPLGEEYLKIVDEGFNSRWIDIYENRGKRSGAYSSGSYDSKPFILLNYHDTLDSVFTVTHELGHSIHSYLTRENQPYVYGGYGIFVAEVASTANESLLLDHMLNNCKDKNEKLYLLNHYLESFRTTVFRQAMFAEFEKIIYEHLEKGEALTAEYLCNSYKELNRLYYGPDVVMDDEIAIEWARIPHFYYNYYVFQYATGFSAAVSLSEKILNGGKDDVEGYLNFLKSGSSDYPINVLKKAGVDMTTKEPVNNAMNTFRKLVDEFELLMNKG